MVIIVKYYQYNGFLFDLWFRMSNNDTTPPPPPGTVDSQWKWGCSTGELETVGTCATLLPLKTYTHTCTCTVLILVSCPQSSSMSCRIHLLPLHLHELSNLLLDSSSENLSGLFHVYLNGYCDHACPPTQIFISWVSGKILYQKVPVLSGNMFETFTRLTLPNCFVPTFGPVNWQQVQQRAIGPK